MIKVQESVDRREVEWIQETNTQTEEQERKVECCGMRDEWDSTERDELI